MAHNYQYLHSEIRSVYKDLPVPIHTKIPEELKNDALKHAFIMDASDISLQESYAYFMVQDARGAMNLFFAKNARKLNSSSMAFFTQCAGWKFNSIYSLPAGELIPKDSFPEIFSFPFLTEAELDRYANGDSGVAFGFGSSVPPQNTPVFVAPEAMRAIFHGVIARWDLRTEPVYIEVPSDWDYNTYVMNAVREIYSYFPVALKCRVGFCSFIAPGNEEKYPGISLIFVPASMSNAKSIRLDGSTATSYQQLCDISFGSRVDAFISHLSYLQNPEERKEFLKSVLIDAEYSAADDKIASVEINNYTILGDGMRILKLEGTPVQKFGEWFNFAANYKKFPKGISTQIFQYIDSQLTEDTFKEILSTETAFPQPEKLSEFRGILEKLFLLCRSRKDLRPLLWNYVQQILTNRGFGNEECFDWLHANKNSLLKLTDSDGFDGFVSSVSAKCVCEILSAAEEKINQLSLNDIAKFRTNVQRVIQDAQTAASKYGEEEQVKLALHKTAEDRIADSAQDHFQRLSSTPPKTGDQFSKDIKSCESMLSLLKIEEVYEKNQSISAQIKEYKKSLIEKYILLCCETADKKIRTQKIENCREYRKMYQAELEGVQNAVSRYIALKDWCDQLTVHAENRICEFVRDYFTQITAKNCINSEDYKSAIEQCSNAIQMLSAEDLSEEITKTRAEIEAHRNQLTKAHQELLSSVETLIASFQDNYFLGIRKYAERISGLTDTQRIDVLDELKKLKPGNLTDYRETYFRQTGRQLNAYALINNHAEEGRIIAADLREFFRSAPISLSVKDKTQFQIAEELDWYIIISKLLENDDPVLVETQLSENYLEDVTVVRMQARTLRNLVMLNLEKDQLSGETEDTIIGIIRALRAKGIISSEHDYAVVEMLARCGFQNSAAALMSEIGFFEGTFIKHSIKNDLAAKAPAENKRMKILSGVLGGIAVVSVAASIILGISLGSANREMKGTISALNNKVSALTSQLAELEASQNTHSEDQQEAPVQDEQIPALDIHEPHMPDGVHFYYLTE